MQSSSSYITHPSSFIKRILVIDMGTLSEVMMSLPALQTLRRQFPDARITVVAGSTQGEVIQLAGCSNETITLDHQALTSSPKLIAGLKMAKAMGQLRTRRFDLAVNLNDFRETGWLAWASGARERLGPQRQGSSLDFLYTARVLPERPGQYLVDRYAQIVESLGLIVEDRQIRLPVPRTADAAVEKRMATAGLRAGELLVGLAPGTETASHPWPYTSFAEVGARLAGNFNARIVILGEASLALKIAAQVRTINKHQAIFLPKLTVAETLAALARCTILISSDFGPTHLAAAMDTPTVVLVEKSHELTRSALLSTRHQQISNVEISVDEVFEATCTMLRTHRTGALFER